MGAGPTTGARQRRLGIAIAAVGLVLGIGTVAYFATADIVDPRANLPYLLWKVGLGRFSVSYAGLIARDSYGQSLRGLTVAEFQEKTGASLHDGLQFEESTYRGVEARRHAEMAPAERLFWFDDNPEGWDWCVVVRNGKVLGFALIKG